MGSILQPKKSSFIEIVILFFGWWCIILIILFSFTITYSLQIFETFGSIEVKNCGNLAGKNVYVLCSVNGSFISGKRFCFLLAKEFTNLSFLAMLWLFKQNFAKAINLLSVAMTQTEFTSWANLRLAATGLKITDLGSV